MFYCIILYYIILYHIILYCITLSIYYTVLYYIYACFYMFTQNIWYRLRRLTVRSSRPSSRPFSSRRLANACVSSENGQEIAVKMRVFGCRDFLCGADWYWSWFDILCAAGTVETPPFFGHLEVISAAFRGVAR